MVAVYPAGGWAARADAPKVRLGGFIVDIGIEASVMVRWEEQRVGDRDRRATFTPVGRGALADATLSVFLGIDRLVSMTRGRSEAATRAPRLVKRVAR